MTNKKAAPVQEQPSDHSPNSTADPTAEQQALEAIRRGLFAAGCEHDHWERFADCVLENLKGAGFIKIQPKGAYFLLPNGETAEVLLVTRDGARPRIVNADASYEPPIMSASGITKLALSLDPEAQVDTKFHIHERNRSREKAEEIATEIQRNLRGKAVEVAHLSHNATTWLSVKVPTEDVEYIIFYTPGKGDSL